MDFYISTPVGPFPVAAGAAFTTFTTRQDISPQPLPLVNANMLRLGTKIEMEASGEISSTGTPTIVLGFYIGTVAGAITTPIAETGAITISTGAAWPWNIRWTGLVIALGTSGSVVGEGVAQIGSSLTAFATSAIPITQALRTFTWDTTIARAVGVCGTWSASSASNSVKTNDHRVQIIN